MNEEMFQPIFNSDDKLLLENIQEIGRHAWLIDHIPLIPKQEVWFRRDVAIGRAAATTRIEGATLSDAEVGELLRGNPPTRPSKDETANINAHEAYRFVDYLSDARDIPIDELAIRELNRYFLAGGDELLTPGIYRKGQNQVGSYTPPDQGDVPSLMREFTDWLNSENGLDPGIKASLAHLQLIAIHPFWDGNGRVARALATLLLQRSNLHFRRLLSLERFLWLVRDKYYFHSIELSLGERYEPNYDATPFLVIFTTAIRTASEALLDSITDWHRMAARVQELLEQAGLNKRQADGLLYAFQTGSISRPEYIEVTGAAPGTASRDLAKLARLRLVVAEGETRGRKYVFDRELFAKSVETPDTAQQPGLC
jgi:Fic family protein